MNMGLYGEVTYASGTKWFYLVKAQEDYEELLRYLTKFNEWAEQ